ncbi:palmitoyltransferase ZDHHC12 isoform X1 [Myotis yumanensis]|uniref:palmitoyltransferase ZDHHC12 isoform X1 n=1 Tax=Myotis yumanensis TaxID=159337 RepID=UPI0038D502C4
MAPWALLSPGVLVRTGHTVLTWGITLVLFLHDTGEPDPRHPDPPAPPWTPDITATMGRTGGAFPAPHLPAPRPGLPAALSGRVTHGPRLREHPAPGGGQGGADSHGSSSHRPSALQTLHGAATPAGPALQRVPPLRPPLRPPLPLDGELCGGTEPPALRGLPGAAACGASVGPVPGMVGPAAALCVWGEGERGQHVPTRCAQPDTFRGPTLHHWPALLGSLGRPAFSQLWAPIPLLPHRSGLRFFQPWGLWLRSSGLLFATFLLLSLFSMVAGLLLASHIYLVASNTTTWEFLSSHRIAYLRQRPGNPFDRGLVRNLAHFFCGWPSGPWETLLAEEEEEEGEGSSQAV